MTVCQVVFVGPFEHHSNLLPWREMGADMVRVRETRTGLVDIDHLREELKVTTDSLLAWIEQFFYLTVIIGFRLWLFF